MQDSQEDEFFIDMTYPLTGDQLRFDTAKEFVAWAEHERMHCVSTGQGQHEPALKELAVLEQAVEFKRTGIQARLMGLSGRGFVPTTTPLGAWLKTLGGHQREIARSAVDGSLNAQIRSAQDVAVIARAVVLAHRSLGVAWAIAGEAERDVWRKDRATIRAESDRALNELREARIRSDEVFDASVRSFEASAQEQAEAAQERHVQLDALIEQKKKVIEETNATYEDTLRKFREHMALEAPVKYWNDQAQQHGKSAKKQWRHVLWYGLGLVVLLMSLLGGAWWLTKESGTAPSWIYAGLAIFAAVGLGLVRMAAKSWAAHQHLESVYSEKAVMTQVYLALMNNEALDKTTDRPLLLGAIFQPSSTGLVKDDHLPPTIVEAASKLIGGRG